MFLLPYFNTISCVALKRTAEKGTMWRTDVRQSGYRWRMCDDVTGVAKKLFTQHTKVQIQYNKCFIAI